MKSGKTEQTEQKGTGNQDKQTKTSPKHYIIIMILFLLLLLSFLGTLNFDGPL